MRLCIGNSSVSASELPMQYLCTSPHLQSAVVCKAKSVLVGKMEAPGNRRLLPAVFLLAGRVWSTSPQGSYDHIRAGAVYQKTLKTPAQAVTLPELYPRD